MKSPGIFTKAAALTSFTLLISAFVAYQAGVFEQPPNYNVMTAALAGEDSTGAKDPTENSTSASVKETPPDSIDRQHLMWSSKSMRMDLPKIELDLKRDIKKKKRKKARHDSTNTDQQRRTQPSTSK